MNDQLSEAFEKAMPEQPATTGWGAAARRRVARRRAAAAGVAGSLRWRSPSPWR